eukprot:jgi/Mesvir1/3756/Mv15030-RA.1
MSVALVKQFCARAASPPGSSGHFARHVLKPRTQINYSRAKFHGTVKCESPDRGWKAEPVQEHETDVVVIGSGLGGLCCAALLAKYGIQVTVLESHKKTDHPHPPTRTTHDTVGSRATKKTDHPTHQPVPPTTQVVESHKKAGGVCHAFTRKDPESGAFYQFESGPHLYSGMTARPAINPIGQVLDALGEKLPVVEYDNWMVHLPEGKSFLTKIGAEQFYDVLRVFGSPSAPQQWAALQQYMAPLASIATALPIAAIREDPAALLTVGRYLPGLLRNLPTLGRLQGPYSGILDAAGVTDPFIRNWMDLLCFLLSGLPADGTIAAEMAVMFAEWYRPGCKLEFPLGGAQGIVDLLIKSMMGNGGRLMLSAHVEEVVMSPDGKRAAGVRIRNNAAVAADNNKVIIRARKGVVSNASIWDTMAMLPPGTIPLPAGYRETSLATPQTESFMHLHVAIDAAGLDGLEIHHAFVKDWSLGVAAPQNVVLVSIPSVLDPSLAPPGKHVIHAYTPGSEPYELWQGLERGSAKYNQLKEERSQILWEALERAIPDVRSRVLFSMVGSPITQERYVRRNRGTYGPAIRAGEGTFPGHSLPVPGLYHCGDSTFPGIGVPAVAASGMITANTLAPLSDHWALLNKLAS